MRQLNLKLIAGQLQTVYVTGKYFRVVYGSAPMLVTSTRPDIYATVEAGKAIEVSEEFTSLDILSAVDQVVILIIGNGIFYDNSGIVTVRNVQRQAVGGSPNISDVGWTVLFAALATRQKVTITTDKTLYLSFSPVGTGYFKILANKTLVLENIVSTLYARCGALGAASVDFIDEFEVI